MAVAFERERGCKDLYWRHTLPATGKNYLTHFLEIFSIFRRISEEFLEIFFPFLGYFNLFSLYSGHFESVVTADHHSEEFYSQ